MQMEQNKWRKQPFDGQTAAPVFVSGLARSGSTLLLNRLTATGVFSTSTYRHMPFVLAPNMWSGATKSQQRQSDAVERAHGDGMTHSFDSEEAFEEVFWRAISDPKTTTKSAATLPWNAKIKAEDLAQFRLFMTSVIKAGSAPRYLSKNNNNITRIPTLLKSSKTAQIVIPFRNPVDFAGSTLSQHKRFLAGHADNPFDAKYMAWLGHHEFGPYFKPAGAPGVEPTDTVTPDYLCRYWSAVYTALLDVDSDRVHFFDYDAFCAAPKARLRALGKALSLDPAPSPPDGVHAPKEYDKSGISAEALDAAMKLHLTLQSRAI